MVGTLALLPIFGLPLIVYLGVVTLSSFTFTAILGYYYHKGRPILAFKWHPTMAVISLALAVIHATLGLSIFVGF